MTGLGVPVRMNHGRWLADCPRPGCVNAEEFGEGLTGEAFWCRPHLGGCGLRCRADWPAEVAAIEQLLLARPVPATRNWWPGESLHDLLHENVMHGIVPNGPLLILGNTITALPLTERG